MKPQLMIIDDSEDQVQLMKTVFKMVDPSIQIISASDGDEALDILRSKPKLRPKVILLDLRMPKMDGIEVLKEIKNNSLTNTIPVCVFSNGDLSKDICDSYSNSASFYFKKPSGIDAMKKFAEYFNGIWFDFACLCE